MADNRPNRRGPQATPRAIRRQEENGVAMVYRAVCCHAIDKIAKRDHYIDKVKQDGADVYFINENEPIFGYVVQAGHQNPLATFNDNDLKIEMIKFAGYSDSLTFDEPQPAAEEPGVAQEQ